MNYYFLRHFQTKIEPNRPVSQWELSEEGRKELFRFIDHLNNLPFKNILTSSEKKAKVIAKAINKKNAVPYKELEVLKELDRDKAGYLENDYN